MIWLPMIALKDEWFSVHSKFFYAIQILLGSLYLALLSQLEIPLRPVPITLHTFAVLTLALYLGKNKAALSAIVYLAAATIGLPVFPSGYINPFWILDPSAGYCLSFPFAAYVIGAIAEKKKPAPLFTLISSVVAGQALIYLCGVSWLMLFVGWEEALAIGLYPFLFLDTIKMVSAISFKMGTNKISSALSL